MHPIVQWLLQSKLKTINIYLSPQTPFPIFNTNLDSSEVGLISHRPIADFKELDERCLEMMEVTSRRNARGLRVHRCTVCGKEEIIGAIKSHIEIHHLQDVNIPCNQCEKTFRSRNSLAKHKHFIHKQGN